MTADDIIKATVLKLEPGDICVVEVPEHAEDYMQNIVKGFGNAVKAVGLEGKVAVLLSPDKLKFHVVRA